MVKDPPDSMEMTSQITKIKVSVHAQQQFGLGDSTWRHVMPAKALASVREVKRKRCFRTQERVQG